MNLRKGNIKVHPTKEVDLYKIYKQLERDNLVYFKFDKLKHENLMKKIGHMAINTKDQSTKKYRLLPPAKTKNNDFRIIALNPNFKIQEKPQKGIFRFLRRKP